jgi:hypothetical protein
MIGAQYAQEYEVSDDQQYPTNYSQVYAEKRDTNRDQECHRYNQPAPEATLSCPGLDRHPQVGATRW